MAWTLQALLGDAGVAAEFTADASVADLAYDSRQVGAGALFCCIPGANADGHDFARAAVDAGATALLVERRLDLDVPQALVPSVRAALGPLADAFFGHPSSTLAVAGVTGTNGKTTVTYILESIATAAGLAPGIVGTISARFAGTEEPAQRTTPEAVDVQRLFRRMLDNAVDVVAMEATSDALAAGRLRGTRFVTTAFTNLTQDHLNTHGSMEAYFDAKCILFDRAYTSRAVINIDDAYGRELLRRVGDALDVTTFGTDADIAVTGSDLRLDGTSMTLRTPAGATTLQTPLVGPYNVSNVMCAIGLALDLGISLEAAAAGVGTLDTVPGRLERVDAGQSFLALVDYAHTPDALEQALRACRALAAETGGGRVIVVFGCGGDRDRAKRPQMGEIATRLAELTIITSDNPRSEDPDAIIAEIEAGAAQNTNRNAGHRRSIADRTEAIGEALREARSGDVVLVAGKGHEQGQQFADRTIPFDDRTVVRELLSGTSCLS